MGTVLMSPAVTCLSNMSDTTNAPLLVSAPHEVEEQATVGVKNAASSLHRIRAQTIGIAAVELLKESKSKQRLRSENKWIVWLFHAATARLTT